MLRFHSLRVAEVRPDAEDALAIALEVPEALRGEYRGSPGQHVVVRARIEGEETRRTYSMVNAPGEWPLRIVPRVHALGRMSRYLAEQLRAGDMLDILPPNGSFTPRRASAGGTYVAFAAGCGITPVISVVRALLRERDTRVIVFYGNTGSGRTMCLEELQGLKDLHLGRLSLHFVMSREPQEVELYNGRIDPVRVREFAASLFRATEVAEYFICGPGDMIERVSTALGELGVDAARVHAEHFTVATTATEAAGAVHAAAERAAPPAAERAVPPAAAPVPGLAEVTVHMDGRQRSFTMKIGDETVLEGAARAGVELPFSCRAGVCSTCRTKVVRGEVVMAQNYALEDWELAEGYVLACQSSVRTAQLELDYDAR